MKKLLSVLLVLTLSMGVGILGACTDTGTDNNNGNAGNSENNNANANNNSTVNSAAPISSRTAADTVLQFADLCNARNFNALNDYLIDVTTGITGEIELDSEGYTFVKMKINVQNPNAQMEPGEIDWYANEVSDLLNTAIICVEQINTYRANGTNVDEDFVTYKDFYLISTQSHPDWMIVWITDQAGY